MSSASETLPRSRRTTRILQRLVLDTARFTAERGFAALWCPERHCHSFGGRCPNPAVLGAAMAMATSRVQIRSGNVVLPLHQPVRVVVEWSVVDNLSPGRPGLGVASGWFPSGFLLSPDTCHNRTEIFFDPLETVRKLWRGEDVQLTCRYG